MPIHNNPISRLNLDWIQPDLSSLGRFSRDWLTPALLEELARSRMSLSSLNIKHIQPHLIQPTSQTAWIDTVVVLALVIVVIGLVYLGYWFGLSIWFTSMEMLDEAIKYGSVDDVKYITSENPLLLKPIHQNYPLTTALTWKKRKIADYLVNAGTIIKPSHVGLVILLTRANPSYWTPLLITCIAHYSTIAAANPDDIQQLYRLLHDCLAIPSCEEPILELLKKNEELCEDLIKASNDQQLSTLIPLLGMKNTHGDLTCTLLNVGQLKSAKLSLESLNSLSLSTLSTTLKYCKDTPFREAFLPLLAKKELCIDSNQAKSAPKLWIQACYYAVDFQLEDLINKLIEVKPDRDDKIDEWKLLDDLSSKALITNDKPRYEILNECRAVPVSDREYPAYFQQIERDPTFSSSYGSGFNFDTICEYYFANTINRYMHYHTAKKQTTSKPQALAFASMLNPVITQVGILGAWTTDQIADMLNGKVQDIFPKLIAHSAMSKGPMYALKFIESIATHSALKSNRIANVFEQFIRVYLRAISPPSLQEVPNVKGFSGIIRWVLQPENKNLKSEGNMFTLLKCLIEELKWDKKQIEKFTKGLIQCFNQEEETDRYIDLFADALTKGLISPEQIDVTDPNPFQPIIKAVFEVEVGGKNPILGAIIHHAETTSLGKFLTAVENLKASWIQGDVVYYPTLTRACRMLHIYAKGKGNTHPWASIVVQAQSAYKVLVKEKHWLEIEAEKPEENPTTIEALRKLNFDKTKYLGRPKGYAACMLAEANVTLNEENEKKITQAASELYRKDYSIEFSDAT